MKKTLLLFVAFVSSWTAAAQTTYCTPSFSTGCSFGDYIDDVTIGTFSDLSTGCASNSYYDGTSDTVTMTIGVASSITLTSGYSNQYYGVWIDLNNDGDFDDTNEFLWSSASASGSAGSATTGSLLVNTSATPGSYRLRILDHYGGGQMSASESCSGASYGETHDYTAKLEAAPACLDPINVSLNMGQFDATVSWDADTNAMYFLVEYGASGFTLGSGDTAWAYGNSAFINGLMATSAYDFYVTTICSATDSSSTVGPITDSTNNGIPTYCNAGPTSTADSEITGVQLTGDNFSISQMSTGCGSTGVQSFLNTDSADVSLGTSYTMNVTMGTCGGNYGGALAAWIDWNRDGDFNDFNEQIGIYTGTPTTVVPFSFTVPVGADTGLTVMRVMQRESGTASTTTPCATFTWGAVEDYLIHITNTPPACPTPGNLTLNAVSDSSVSISWSSLDTTFDIQYGFAGYSQATGAYTTLTVNDTSAIITGLNAATGYDFYIANNCVSSNNGYSNWAGPITVITNCVAFSTPFTENFENDSTGSSAMPNAPLCWNYTEDMGAAGYGYVDGSGFPSPHSGSNMYRLYSSTSGSSEYLVSPEIVGLDSANKQVEFWVTTSTWMGSAEFVIGTMSLPNDASTFHVLDTLEALSSGWTQYTYYIDSAFGYNGTDKYFAFGTSDNSSFVSTFLDDIEFSDAPSCLPPATLTVGTVGQDSALINFTTTGSETYIEYGPMGFTQGTGSVDTTTSNASYWLTNLASNSSYEVYIWQKCADGSISPQIGPVSFTTSACSASDMCEYKVVLTDSYGDGWNGALVDLKNSSGSVVATYGSTFTTGSYDTISVMFCENVNYTLELSAAGSYVSEVGLEVYKDGTLIDSYANTFGTSVGTQMASFTAYCSSFCASPTSLTLGVVGQDSAQVFFTTSGTETYLEFGPAGFGQGTGTIDTLASTVNSFWYTNLTSGQSYDVYVYQLCSNGGVSSAIGPLNFTTSACPLSSTCVYDIVLTDSYGDGWNGGLVDLVDASGNSIVTMGSDFLTGSYDTVSLSLCDGISYSIEVSDDGSWPSEMGVQVLKDGSSIASYSNSSSTTIGTVMANFTTNCTFNCPAPSNITFTPSKYSSGVSWTNNGATGTFYYEYGPQGFIQGTGQGIMDSTSANNVTLNGLASSTCYDFYLYIDCGASGISDTIGPNTFCTAACYDSSLCEYVIYMGDTYGDGWNGAYLNVYANGSLYTTLGQNFTTGSADTATFTVCSGQFLEVVIGSGGNYSYEVFFDMMATYDSTQYIGVTSGNFGMAGDTLGNMLANCAPLSCPTPANLGATAITPTTATVSWTGGSGSFECGYKPAAAATMSTVVSPSSTMPLNGLTPATQYYFEVREICAVGDTSYYDSFYFTTDSCPEISVSGFSSNLDSTITSGQYFTFDWSGSNYTGYSIDFGDGTTANGSAAQSVQHAYTAAGSYTVTLTLTSDCDSETITLFVNSTIGQEEIPGLGQVVLFPNPTGGVFEVQLDGLTDRAELQVFDAVGQLIVTKTMEGAQGQRKASFDLSNKAAGSYLVRVLTDRGMVQQTVVVRH